MEGLGLRLVIHKLSRGNDLRPGVRAWWGLVAWRRRIAWSTWRGGWLIAWRWFITWRGLAAFPRLNSSGFGIALFEIGIGFGFGFRSGERCLEIKISTYASQEKKCRQNPRTRFYISNQKSLLMNRCSDIRDTREPKIKTLQRRKKKTSTGAGFCSLDWGLGWDWDCFWDWISEWDLVCVCDFFWVWVCFWGWDWDWGWDCFGSWAFDDGWGGVWDWVWSWDWDWDWDLGGGEGELDAGGVEA